jgi:hypothetical protein
MEIYKYILLVVGGYIAICRLFKNSPIRIEKLFGDKISFIMHSVVVFGFLFWIFSEFYKRLFSKKEGWMSIADIIQSARDNEDIDASLIPSDVKDIPDVPCPESEALSPAEKKQLEELKKKPKAQLSEVDKSRLEKLEGMVRQSDERKKNTQKIGKTTGEKDVNPTTGKCHGQFSDIPTGYYGFTITTREKSDKTFKYHSDKATGKNIQAEGKVVNEKKMRPLDSVATDCKLKTSPDGKPSVERSVEPKSSNSDSKKCVNRVNILKSQKDKKQYDPNDMSAIRNKELTPSEKEEKQKNKDFDVDINLVNPKPVYYEPGSFTFGASTYVPNHEQSVLLSETTGLSQTAPLSLTPNNTGGFCASLQNDKLGLDKKCQSLDPDVCPSTSCCVLLGGEKCFAGDETGPSNKSAFSDTTITNRDYYYYKSKCYGHCP